MSFAHHSLLLFNSEMCVIVLVISKALLLRSCLTLDVKLLHRRVGYIGKGEMNRLAREGLVRGLEGGVVGEMDVSQGCELARPRPHPHRPVEPEFRATRPLELVHANLAGPTRVQSWGGGQILLRGDRRLQPKVVGHPAQEQG